MNTLKALKTVKALKAANIWGCIFCCSCIVSTVCLAIHHYHGADLFWGILFAYGWIANPFPVFFCYRAAKAYWEERKIPEYRQMIGRKWIGIVIWPVITTAFYCISAGLFVHYTGGV